MNFSKGILAFLIGVHSTSATAGIPAFAPLTPCNDMIDIAVCSSLSTLALGSNALVTIPCGECAKFDVTDGSSE